MTYKSHLINFCYLTYLHLNFSTDTIVFSHAFSRLRTLSFFDFSTPLFVYLFSLHHTTICPHCEKKSYKKQKRP